MSQFDRYTSAEYVEGLRAFLRISRQNFMRDAGFTAHLPEDRKGRIPKYPEAALRALEDQVNAKAARAEADDTTFGERYALARDYAGLNDAQVGAQIGVSREIARRWAAGTNQTQRTAELSQLLGVPQDWLEHGGEQYLPANSHLGVRVGGVYKDERGNTTFVGEAAKYREQLYALTQSILAEVPDDANESYTQAYIEWAVCNKFELAQVARRAGGRWQVVANTLLFAPWVPIHEHGLQRRAWSDEVEAIVQEELAANPSVFAAWKKIDERCQAMGLKVADRKENVVGEYPTRIALHKRVEKERLRAEQFGVDLNDVVAAAVAQHAPQE